MLSARENKKKNNDVEEATFVADPEDLLLKTMRAIDPLKPMEQRVSQLIINIIQKYPYLHKHLPMLSCISKGYDAKVIKTLIEAKAEIKGSAMNMAISLDRVDVVSVLLEAKANLEAYATDLTQITHRGQPLFFTNIENGHEAMIKTLLEAKIRVDIKESEATPLSIAVKKGYTDVVKVLLLDKANLDSVGNKELLWNSIKKGKGYIGVVNALLEAKADPNPIDKQDEMLMAPIFFAMHEGCSDIAISLIDSKAIVNYPTDVSVAFIFSLVSKVGRQKPWSNLKREYNILELILSGFTPLHAAACFGHADVVNKLLEAKASLEEKSCDKITALDFARMMGYSDIVGRLLSQSLDDIKAEEKSAKHTAIFKLRELLKVKRDPRLVDSNEVENEFRCFMQLHQIIDNLSKAGNHPQLTELYEKAYINYCKAEHIEARNRVYVDFIDSARDLLNKLSARSNISFPVLLFDSQHQKETLMYEKMVAILNKAFSFIDEAVVEAGGKRLKIIHKHF